jgi:hypothetical protein
MGEFAEALKIGRRLGMRAEDFGDADVDRLVQSTSLVSARLQLKTERCFSRAYRPVAGNDLSQLRVAHTIRCSSTSFQ